MQVYIINPEGRVICDDCDEEYTEDNKTTGGILFGSRAICPKCQDKWIANAKRFNEERFIRARCPEGMSFRDWVINVIR